MKSDRVATFGSVDNVLAGKIQRKKVRIGLESQRRTITQETERASSSVGASFINSDTEVSSSETDAESEGFDPSFTFPQTTPTGPATKPHSRVFAGTGAFIPHNILQSPRLVSLATRMKMTPTQQAAYTEAFIEEAGGDPSKVFTSYATADRSRRQVGDNIAKMCKELWIPPKFLSLHWDSKLMSSANK